MEAAAHLPLIDFGGRREPDELDRITGVVAAARELGFVAVSANDHLTFARPWLDGLTALGAVAREAGSLELATTVALPTVRGPVQLAASLSALNALTPGRVTAGVGPGSSAADYALAGVPWEERWSRFDEAVRVLRALLTGADQPQDPRWYRVDQQPSTIQVADPPIQVWLASWGSPAGLRRVVRWGDGWLASAYHTTPVEFGAALATLAGELERQGRSAATFGHALATMWTWVTDDESDADRVLVDVLAPAVGRSPEQLRGRVCVGTPERCAQLLDEYAAAGCRRVHFWPVADEVEQLTRLARDVLPQIRA